MLPRSDRDHDDSASEPPNDSSWALLRCCCWIDIVHPDLNAGLLHLTRGSSGLQPALIRLHGADRCIAFMPNERSIADSSMRSLALARLRAKPTLSQGDKKRGTTRAAQARKHSCFSANDQARIHRGSVIHSSVVGAADLPHRRYRRPWAAVKYARQSSERVACAMERLQAEAEAQMRRKGPAPPRDEPAAKRRKAEHAPGEGDTTATGATQSSRSRVGGGKVGGRSAPCC